MRQIAKLLNDPEAAMSESGKDVVVAAAVACFATAVVMIAAAASFCSSDSVKAQVVRVYAREINACMEKCASNIGLLRVDEHGDCGCLNGAEFKAPGETSR